MSRFISHTLKTMPDNIDKFGHLVSISDVARAHQIFNTLHKHTQEQIRANPDNFGPYTRAFYLPDYTKGNYTINPQATCTNKYCTNQLNNSNRLTLDHIIPLCKGGNNTPCNYQILCDTCNKAKGGLINPSDILIDRINKRYRIRLDYENNDFNYVNNRLGSLVDRFMWILRAQMDI